MKMKKLTATFPEWKNRMEDRNFTESGSGGTICGTGTSDGIAEDFRSGIPHPQK